MIQTIEPNFEVIAATTRDQLGSDFVEMKAIERERKTRQTIQDMQAAGRRMNAEFNLSQQMLDKLGLAHRAEHSHSQLSGGQQQRVAIARALVNKPAVLLADEPTGNLDTAHGEEVMRILQQINAEGTTIVMVTHSRAHAARASRTVGLLDGAIAALATAAAAT